MFEAALAGDLWYTGNHKEGQTEQDRARSFTFF